ncbi:MAG: PEP-CTERM sorting domain-containing protein [Candidatus Auribacterota bacterium]|jgi:probable HAF family extracellular repeat protein|nr:PEP-CTERM sorting domain-containing protein [Candidatus Auribacterota bacterium]
MKTKTLLLLIASILVVMQPHAATAYLSFTDIGTVSGKKVYGQAINSKGEVVGWLKDDNNITTPFYWNGSEMIELSTSQGYAFDINDNSVIAGQYAPSGSNIAFAWTSTGGFVDFLPGTNDSASTILNDGTVYGRYSGTVPSRWISASSYVDYAIAPGFGQGQIRSVNPLNGHAVGNLYNWTGIAEDRQAICWTSPSSYTLLTLPSAGHESMAMSINSSNQIAGFAFDESNNGYPVFWNSSSEMGEILDSSGRAYFISETGDVFGSSGGVAVMWSKDITGWTAYDLNDYIDPNSGYLLIEAHEINGQNQLVCIASNGNDIRTVVLNLNESIPVPEPASVLLVLSAVGTLFVRRIRK